MLPHVKIKEAERLLAEGTLSHREIAAEVGISRTTVGSIASGRRRDYEALERERDEQLEPLGPLARCSGCGGMVYTPCVLCRARARKAKERETLRVLRRQARERAVKRLLAVVWKASQQRERDATARGYLPTAATGGPSDCK